MCSAKLEDPYLVEWVKYNIEGLGFDAIYIYDNNDDPGATPATLLGLDPSTRARVFLKHEPDSYMLLHRAFAEWTDVYSSKYRALAFVDPDEFIVLHRHGTISELLEAVLYPFGGALGINWTMFGSNGLEEYDPRPVTQRFTRREASDNPHVKSIVVCADLAGMVNPHYPRLLGGAVQRDTGGKVFEGHFNQHGPLDVAHLNHYWFKSYPEWLIKRNKGHVDIDVAERGLQRLSMFADGDEHSNAVEDDNAWRFYRSLLESQETRAELDWGLERI